VDRGRSVRGGARNSGRRRWRSGCMVGQRGARAWSGGWGRWLGSGGAVSSSLLQSPPVSSSRASLPQYAEVRETDGRSGTPRRRRRMARICWRRWRARYYTVSHHSVVVCLPTRRRARHKSRTRFYNCMTRRRRRHMRSAHPVVGCIILSDQGPPLDPGQPAWDQLRLVSR
jgi:hypothetical protein